MGEVAMAAAMAGGSVVNSATTGAFNLGATALASKAALEIVDKQIQGNKDLMNLQLSNTKKLASRTGLPEAAFYLGPSGSSVARSGIGGNAYIQMGVGYAGKEFHGTPSQIAYGYGDQLAALRYNAQVNDNPGFRRLRWTR